MGLFMNEGRKKQHFYRAPQIKEDLTKCKGNEASKSQLAGYLEVPQERGWKPWNYLGHLKLSWIRHLITLNEEKVLLTTWGGIPKGPTRIPYAGVVSTRTPLVKHSAIPEHDPVVSNTAKCRQSNTEGSLQAPESVFGSLAHHQPLMRVPSFAQADCWLTRN